MGTGDTMINCLCSPGHPSPSVGRVYPMGSQPSVALTLWALGGFQKTIAGIHDAIGATDGHRAAGQSGSAGRVCIYFQWAAESDFYRGRLRSYSVRFNRICQMESFV